MTELLELRRIHCQGSPRALGESHGEQLRSEIRGFVAQRLEAARLYMRERGGRTVAELVAAAGRCLAILESWDPAGYTEHMATAAAAGVDAVELYAATNMTDVRDILLLPGDEGCSVVLLPEAASSNGSAILAQTWDLNPTDLDFVVAVHRLPDAAAETWSVTCVGAASLIGMNAAGLAVGTTNIKTRGTRPGVGYLSILHRALGMPDRAQAGAVIAQAPRAAAHTYWVGDRRGATEYECSAERVVRRDGDETPLCRTNHCLSPELSAIEGEPITSSSHARLARLRSAASSRRHDVASLKALFADRSDGLDSINRYVEDEQGTATNACIICLPAERTIWACRGPSDRGRWVELHFDTAAR